MIPVPTSNHNEALTGDVLYSAFLNYEWRQIVVPFIVLGMEQIAATIEDESDRQDFEVLYSAMIDDFYNEDIVMPIGSIMAYPSLTPPDKYVLCDGQALSKTTYAALFALIGTKYGSTSTTFNVPNLSDKFIYGQKIVAGNPQIDSTGGSTRVTLAESEMPAHTHVQNGRNTPAGGVNQSAVSVNVAATAGVATSTVTGSTGGGGSHENMPPYHTLAWMIKALP